MRSLVCLGLEMSTRAYSSKGGYVIKKPSGCKVVIEKVGGLFTIAFAGSECVTDWLMNMLAQGTDFHGCDVHTGFAIQYNSVRHEILRYMSGKPKRVVCCGHSLGGAVATLCALDLALVGHDVACVTFGSPAVGCEKFKTMFHSKVQHSIRVAHFADLVVLLPIQFMHVPSKTITLDNWTLSPHSLQSYYIASQKCNQRNRCC